MRNTPIICLLLVLFASCTRDVTNSTRQLTILGSVYDSSNHVVMPNTWVRLSWYTAAGMEIRVDSVRTDMQGNFTLKTIFESSKFATQTLEVAAVLPGKYISVFDMDHSTVGASIKGVGDQDTLRLTRFPMYEKATLTINLQQTINDNFSELELSYNHGNRDYFVNNLNKKPSGAISYQVTTAAGVRTKLSWKKKFSTGATTSFQDSIMVRANTTNSITVGY